MVLPASTPLWSTSTGAVAVEEPKKFCINERRMVSRAIRTRSLPSPP